MNSLCAIKTKKILANSREEKKKNERQPSQFTRITNHDERSSDHHCGTIVGVSLSLCHTHDYSSMTKFIHRGLSFFLFVGSHYLAHTSIRPSHRMMGGRQKPICEFFFFLFSIIIVVKFTVALRNVFTPNGFLTVSQPK